MKRLILIFLFSICPIFGQWQDVTPNPYSGGQYGYGNFEANGDSIFTCFNGTNPSFMRYNSTTNIFDGLATYAAAYYYNGCIALNDTVWSFYQSNTSTGVYARWYYHGLWNGPTYAQPAIYYGNFCSLEFSFNGEIYNFFFNKSSVPSWPDKLFKFKKDTFTWEQININTNQIWWNGNIQHVRYAKQIGNYVYMLTGAGLTGEYDTYPAALLKMDKNFNISFIDTLGEYGNWNSGLDYYVSGNDTIIYMGIGNCYWDGANGTSGLFSCKLSEGTVKYVGAPANILGTHFYCSCFALDRRTGTSYLYLDDQKQLWYYSISSGWTQLALPAAIIANADAKMYRMDALNGALFCLFHDNSHTFIFRYKLPDPPAPVQAARKFFQFKPKITNHIYHWPTWTSGKE